MSISLKIFWSFCVITIYIYLLFFMNSIIIFSVCVCIHIFSKSNADIFFSRPLASFDAC